MVQKTHITARLNHAVTKENEKNKLSNLNVSHKAFRNLWETWQKKGKQMKTNPDLILREIYGKSILIPIRYNEASNDPLYLNDAAALIWKIAPASKNPYELQKSICDIYGLCADSAEAYSVEKFIIQLMENKLIFD